MEGCGARAGECHPRKFGTSMLPPGPITRSFAMASTYQRWFLTFPATCMPSRVWATFVPLQVVFTANRVIKGALFAGDDVVTLPQQALCGALAGVASATVITPAEVLKCRLQRGDGHGHGSGHGSGRHTGRPVPRSPVRMLRVMVATEGLSSLMRGWGALLMRDVPFNGLFFFSYECSCWAFHSLRAWWGAPRASRSPATATSTSTSGGEGSARAGEGESASSIPAGHGTGGEHLSPAEVLVAGGLAGAAAWGVIYPIDVLKSRIQSTSTPIALRDAVSQLVAEGPRVALRGWSAAVVRAIPANAAVFGGYEGSKRLLRWAWGSDQL